MYIMNNLIRSTNHPLIPREQTYTVDRKLVTIHTEDRDINQWPEPNHFEVSIPEILMPRVTLPSVGHSEDSLRLFSKFRCTQISLSPGNSIWEK